MKPSNDFSPSSRTFTPGAPAVTQVESRVVAAWRDAAQDLGIQFTSPFVAELDGTRVELLGLVHQFGRRVGTVISVIDEPSASVTFPADEDYYASQLSSRYAEYDRQYFIDTLDDWQFFGEDSERPSWYSGKPWSRVDEI